MHDIKPGCAARGFGSPAAYVLRTAADLGRDSAERTSPVLTFAAGSRCVADTLSAP